MNRNSTLPVAALLALLTLGLFALSLSLGPVMLSLGDVADALLGRGDEAGRLIVQQIRLPRAILAGVIGAGLGMSGAALQGLLRNPLADPGVVGVSTMAGLGAVVAFYSGLALLVPLALPLGAMIGALVAVVLLVVLCGRNAGTLTLVLAGAGINSLAAALTSLVLNLAPSPFAAAEIMFWMLGSLADRSLQHVALAVPPTLVGIAVLSRTGKVLDALILGEPVAESLGFSVARARILVVIGTALAVAPGVAVAGAIGFVGLAVPHLLRPLVGHQPSRLLGVSALGGAVLVLGADILVRIVPSTVELKLGVVTSLLGAPLFLALILRLRRRGEVHA
jgi:iron complex transport system permease protein